MFNKQRERKIGIIIGYISTFVAAIVSLIYIPLLLKYIGKSEYGLYQLVGSVMAYFSTMYSSLSTSVVRYYSKYLATKDESNMCNTLAISRRIYRYASLLVIIIAIPIILLIAKIYRRSLSAWEIRESIFMFGIMIANLLVFLNNAIYSSAIIASERFIFRKSLDLISQMLQPFAVVLLLLQYKYAFIIVLVQLIFNSAISILNYWYFKEKLQIPVVYHENNKELVKGLFSLTLSILVVAIVDQIFWKTDQLILGQMYGTSTVAVYAIGSQINSLFISIGCVIPGICLPMITKIIEQKNSNSELSKIFAKLGRYQAYILFPIDAGVLLFGKEFIYLLAGKDFGESYYVALLLMLPYTIDLLETHGQSILQAKGIYKYRTYVMIIAAFINIALTLIWARQFGMLGAALATTFSIGISMGLVMNIIYFRKASLDVGLFWKNVLQIGLGTVIAIIIGYFGIRRVSFTNLYIQLIVHVFLFLIIYCLIMYLIIMNKEEREIVNKVVSKIFKKIL